VRRQNISLHIALLFLLSSLANQNIFCVHDPLEQFDMWCSVEELQEIEPNDVIVREFKLVAQAQTSLQLATDAIVKHCDPQLFDDWQVYQSNKQLYLFIPPNFSLQGLDLSFENFTQTSLKDISDKPYFRYSGATRDALADFFALRTIHSKPCTIVFSGHGGRCKNPKNLEQVRQSGMALGNLRKTYNVLNNKQVKAIINLSCYSSSKRILDYIAQDSYSMPIISGCMGDNPSELVPTVSPKSIQQFHAAFQNLKLCKEHTPQLFKALETYLQCKCCTNNTPLILWPHKKVFRLLAEKKVQKERQKFNKIGKTIFFEKVHYGTCTVEEKIKLSFGSPYITDHTLKQLTVRGADSLEDFANRFKLPSEINCRYKLSIDELRLGQTTLHKVTVLFTETGKSIEGNDQFQHLLKYQKNS